MPTKDLHAKPFDENTIFKLQVFSEYAKAWIPTFVMSSYCPLICIFDFFAGTGYDLENEPGSPIRLLKEIENQSGNILMKKKKIHVYFNEFILTKYEKLQENCNTFISQNIELQKLIKYNQLFIHYENKDFKEIFPKKLSIMENNPSLVFLDQNGIKFLSDEYFLPLLRMKQTDFLFYSSSSYIKRFGNTEAFSENLNIDIEKVMNSSYNHIHEELTNELRKKIPANCKTRLYPFTIKKRANIYGIIFGASHPLAVNKFLELAWKENSINGCANFDIDNDIDKTNQLDLFEGHRLTKLEKFQNQLEKEILSGNLKNNKDVFDYTIEHGFIAKHSDSVLRNLKKQKKINYYDKTPLVNYNQVYKQKRIVNYEVL